MYLYLAVPTENFHIKINTEIRLKYLSIKGS
jgi:hypothetical protein